MIILSDEQTKGRGRFNRNWASSKGKGLWMSLVLRPNVPFSMIPKFNLFVALGIRDAIQSFTNDKVEIKWPNDIYIADKKYVVLTEMIANYDSIDAIICGIGINLNHSDSDFLMILNREQQAFVYIVIIKLIDTHFKKLISSIENDIHNFNKAFYRNSK